MEPLLQVLRNDCHQRALPSDAKPRTTTPEPIFAPAFSASSRSIEASTPSTFLGDDRYALDDRLASPQCRRSASCADLRFRLPVRVRAAAAGRAAALIARVSSCRGARSIWERSLEQVFVFFKPQVGAESGQRFDAANAGGDAGFGDNFEEPDIAGHSGVGAAAKFLADVGNRNDPDLLRIFLAKKRERAAGNGFVDFHDLRLNRQIPEDDLIDLLLRFPRISRSVSGAKWV